MCITHYTQQAPYKDFAILYRTNAQSRAFEEAMRKLNIPYKIYGGLSFYQRKEIKDALAYFRLAINHHDDESLKRIINYPARGIGQTSLDKIMIAAAEHDISMWQVISNLKDFDIGINSGTASKIEDFTTSIKSFTLMIPYKDAFDCANHIAISVAPPKEIQCRAIRVLRCPVQHNLHHRYGRKFRRPWHRMAIGVAVPDAVRSQGCRCHGTICNQQGSHRQAKLLCTRKNSM